MFDMGKNGNLLKTYFNINKSINNIVSRYDACNTNIGIKEDPNYDNFKIKSGIAGFKYSHEYFSYPPQSGKKQISTIKIYEGVNVKHEVTPFMAAQTLHFIAVNGKLCTTNKNNRAIADTLTEGNVITELSIDVNNADDPIFVQLVDLHFNCKRLGDAGQYLFCAANAKKKYQATEDGDAKDILFYSEDRLCFAGALMNGTPHVAYTTKCNLLYFKLESDTTPEIEDTSTGSNISLTGGALGASNLSSNNNNPARPFTPFQFNQINQTAQTLTLSQVNRGEPSPKRHTTLTRRRLFNGTNNGNNGNNRRRRKHTQRKPASQLLKAQQQQEQEQYKQQFYINTQNKIYTYIYENITNYFENDVEQLKTDYTTYNPCLIISSNNISNDKQKTHSFRIYDTYYTFLNDDVRGLFIDPYLWCINNDDEIRNIYYRLNENDVIDNSDSIMLNEKIKKYINTYLDNKESQILSDLQASMQTNVNNILRTKKGTKTTQTPNTARSPGIPNTIRRPSRTAKKGGPTAPGSRRSSIRPSARRRGPRTGIHGPSTLTGISGALTGMPGSLTGIPGTRTDIPGTSV
jgi:hypothetical protein